MSSLRSAWYSIPSMQALGYRKAAAVISIPEIDKTLEFYEEKIEEFTGINSAN